ISWKPRQGEVLFDSFPNPGQRFGKGNHMRVFGFVSNLAPAQMVAKLFATPIVASGCLQVTVRVGTNPHIVPCWRDSQRFNPVERLLVPDNFSGSVSISKAFPAVLTFDSW